jgi:ATP-dependent DNA ligase
MVKVKRVRTIDAVVIGWRPGKEEGHVGSLILALYDDGELRPVGHTSGFSAKEKRELPAKLAPYETGERGMGDPSRWATSASSSGSRCARSWSSRSRSTTRATTASGTATKIVRWRDDKDPRDCRFDQLSQ